MVLPTLVDEKIEGFYQWSKGLKEEDMMEFKCALNRRDKDLSILYKAYVDFQKSDEVCEARRYYYGV